MFVIASLKSGVKLPTAYRDHALTGEFSGYRDCHIRGDLVLIYGKDEKEKIVDIVDIGTHSQLFG